jgi:hypothetical protein
MPLLDTVWEVVALEYPDREAARAAWRKSTDVIPDGDYSSWATRTPDSTRFAVFVCGRPEHVEKVLEALGGVSVEMTEGEAHAFCARRLRGVVRNELEGVEGRITHHRKERYLHADGTLRDLPDA